MDPRMINMVRRLRVDSCRHLTHDLRHINLPELPPEELEIFEQPEK